MIREKDATSAIGHTPIVELTRVVPPGSARVLVKLESHNPTGSMKDRMALAVIDRALDSGRLLPTGTVVEYTGGSTGTSLAFLCAARGLEIVLVTSDAFSLEKRHHMRALGAKLIEIPSEGGAITKELIRAMMQRAEEISQPATAFPADQFENTDAAEGYVPLAEEIWDQAEGRVDAFVQAVGTGHCIAGVARVIRQKNPQIQVVAVEPAESPVLSGGAAGAHTIEGIGAGFVPPLWDPTIADAVVPVSSADAKAMCRRLAREEAIFGGTSSGANVIVALGLAKTLGPNATVTTLICDSGLKYLSTDLYSAE